MFWLWVHARVKKWEWWAVQQNLTIHESLPHTNVIHLYYVQDVKGVYPLRCVGDVLVAAGVITDRSEDQALCRKYFKHAVHCLWLVYDTVVYHAIDKGLEGSRLSEEVEACLAKFQHPINAQELADTHAELEINTLHKNLVDTLFKDFEGVPQAEYGTSFMEMVEILNQNSHVVRTSNWSEFKSSLKLMLPWMQIYDNNKYGRHPPDCLIVLDTHPVNQAAFMESGMFAQSMTGKTYCCVTLGIWLESISIMNKGSKLNSGWLTILNNRNMNDINWVSWSQETRLVKACWLLTG